MADYGWRLIGRNADTYAHPDPDSRSDPRAKLVNHVHRTDGR
jgi:hypothetical protein